MGLCYGIELIENTVYPISTGHSEVSLPYERFYDEIGYEEKIVLYTDKNPQKGDIILCEHDCKCCLNFTASNECRIAEELLNRHQIICKAVLEEKEKRSKRIREFFEAKKAAVAELETESRATNSKNKKISCSEFNPTADRTSASS